MSNKTVLTDEEVKKIINSAKNMRDRALLSLLADTGIRCSEALAIKPQDIDYAGKTVMIPHLKVGIKKKCSGCGRMAGGKQLFCVKCGADISKIKPEGEEKHIRLVNVGDQTLFYIKEYLTARKGYKSEESGLVFAIKRQAVNDIVRSAAEKAGLSGKILTNPETGRKHFVSPHKFRDALAVAWLGSELDGVSESDKQKALQMHLGHRRFETTARYQKLSEKSISDVSTQIRNRRFGK